VRISPTLRALALVPLLAVGVDQARAVMLCGTDAQSCLEAAGRGWIGIWGVALIALYALALALLVARASRLPAARPSFLRLWAIGTTGVAAACGGQAVLATALGGAPLGGGWLGVLALCALAGAVLALVLRARPELQAPRPLTARRPVWLAPAPALTWHAFAPARRARERAPPAI
jgi:hypothetical protein